MTKNTLLMSILTILFLTGCKNDDDDELTYPMNTVYQSVEKEDIEVWTNTNGNITAVSLNETTLDEDEFFTVDIDESIPAASFNFISETEVNIIIDYGSVSDTLSGEYTYADDELTFPALGTTASGSPESFNIKGQARLKESTSNGQVSSTTTEGILTVSSTFIEDTETLKNQLEDGETIAIMNLNYLFEN